MKRTVQNAAADSPDATLAATLKKEGSNGSSRVPEDLSLILGSLQTMRDGDFSVRLPGHWTGIAGKIADTFNEIVTANQQIAQELKRAGQVVGKRDEPGNAPASTSPRELGERWKFPSTRWLTTSSGQRRK